MGYTENARGRRRTIALLAAACTLAAGGACTSGPDEPPPGGEQPAEPFTLAIAPDEGTDQLPISTEVGITLTGAGHISDVTLAKDGSTEKVTGALREDATSWVPAQPLAFDTTYRASVTASSTDGARTETRTTSFRTMQRFGLQTETGLYLSDGHAVGVAAPVVIQFAQPVPEQARAGVQRRLFVTTDPPQPGVWQWPNGNQVWYRAPDYWQPGTKISVRSALRGVPTGDGRYGDADRSATATVGEKNLMVVENKKKEMTVYRDGKAVKRIPVSLGKSSTPSSSGQFVIMTKQNHTVFDTRGEPNGGYVVGVDYAMRLTWGGEFIHSAPWSVADQGVRNVSHGCMNLSPANAKWLFNFAHVGDPVIVRGTEVKIDTGNGWTAWNQTWAEYVKGSALPVPTELANAEGVDPLTGQSPKHGSSAGQAEAGPTTPGPAASPAPSPAPTA